MESQFHSFEFKGYDPRAPEPSCSSSSLLKTFTDEDFFDEESVELIQKGKSEDGSPQSAHEKGNFILSEEKFSSFQQAFQWCQRNRYKYFRHGKTFADRYVNTKYISTCRIKVLVCLSFTLHNNGWTHAM